MKTVEYYADDNTYATRALASLSEARLMPRHAEVAYADGRWVLALHYDDDVDEDFLNQVSLHAGDHGLRGG